MASRPPGFPIPAGFFARGQNIDILEELLTRLMEYGEAAASEDRATAAAYTDAQILANAAKVAATNIWVVESAVVASAFGNGVGYIPLRQGQADSLEIQFVAGKDSIEVAILYAMSAAHAGLVEFKADVLAVGAGEDPSAALVAGTPFTVTPGADTTLHSASKTESAELTLSGVAEGDLVRLKLTRPTGGGDTHTGDCRIIDIQVT